MTAASLAATGGDVVAVQVRERSSIAGVVPPATLETTIMSVWPSVSASPFGRFFGRLYLIDVGAWPVTVGNMIALASVPIMLGVYLSIRLPWAITRYRLTNRRVTIDRGILWKVVQYIDFDRFDSIDIDVKPGQEWFPAGDLVFRLGAIETFRLSGVRRPEAFRQACLKVQQSYLSVAAILRR
jgi:membrane protein YdbS with pleckstrin-like domain